MAQRNSLGERVEEELPSESRKNFVRQVHRHRASKRGIQSEFVSGSLFEEAMGFGSLGTPGGIIEFRPALVKHFADFS